MSFLDFLGDLAVPAAIGYSAYSSSQAAKNASQAQSDAARQSSDTTLRMFETARGDMLPYTETGTQSMFALADLYGIPRPDGSGGYTTGKAFTGTPGYQFRLNEGLKAVDNNMAAKGMRFSGQRAKALNDYAQDTASAEFGNYTNSLRSLAGLGQTSGAQTASASGQAAGQIGAATLAGGNARASGYTGASEAMNNAIGNALYYYRR